MLTEVLSSLVQVPLELHPNSVAHPGRAAPAGALAGACRLDQDVVVLARAGARSYSPYYFVEDEVEFAETVFTFSLPCASHPHQCVVAPAAFAI